MGVRTARMASRSCSVLATSAGGTSGCTRKWRARASRIGGVTPWRASSYDGAAASFSVTTSICRGARGGRGGCRAAHSRRS
jgi:hypothetical protein